MIPFMVISTTLRFAIMCIEIHNLKK